MAGDLVRAVRTEAAIAVQYWGVKSGVLIRWRAVLNVTRTNNEGTKRLGDAACEKGQAGIKAHVWTEAELEAKRQQAKGLNPIEHRREGFRRAFSWSADELALLGTLPDEEVAAKIGRTEAAVRVMHVKRGLANPASPAWTAEEIALLGTAPDPALARQLRRTAHAVAVKRFKLKIPRFHKQGD